MSDHPHLIFKMGEGGELSLSFVDSTTAPPVKGLGDINLGNPRPDAIIDQVHKLESPTGFVDIELPDERTIRRVDTRKLAA